MVVSNVRSILFIYSLSILFRSDVLPHNLFCIRSFPFFLNFLLLFVFVWYLRFTQTDWCTLFLLNFLSVFFSSIYFTLVFLGHRFILFYFFFLFFIIFFLSMFCVFCCVNNCYTLSHLLMN